MSWAIEQTFAISGRVGSGEPRLLASDSKGNRILSVRQAVAGLTDSTIVCKDGFCVIESASQQRFYCVYRDDRQRQALDAYGHRLASPVGRVRWCLLLWAASLLFLGVPALVGYAGLFACDAGKALLFRTEARLRALLLPTPLEQRGHLWHAAEKAVKVGLQLPLFIGAGGGERLVMYRHMHESLGDITPMGEGIALHSYKAVSDVVNDADQPRGRYLGAMPVPDMCMAQSTLIFQSTGPEHTRMRKFLLRTLPSLSKKTCSNCGLLPEPEAVGEFSIASEEWVKRSLVRNLWFRLFKTVPDEDLELLLLSYYTWGGTCVLGDTFHKLTFGQLLKKVQHIRDGVFEAANATEVGRTLLAAAVSREKYSPDEAVDVLMQLVDGFMFAGLLGTGHLTTHTLARIRGNPQIYLPLWRRDRQAFLLESARLDPPVTSVTAVLGRAQNLSVASGWGGNGFVDVQLEEGTTMQLVLSEANVDPAVFGGITASVERALEFDPTRPKAELRKILSWNGVHERVAEGSSPRGCLGYHVSFDVAQKVVERFLPSAERDHDGAGIQSIDPRSADSAFGSSKSMFNKGLAYSLWCFTCIFALVVVRTKGYGGFTAYYGYWLVAQIALSVGAALEYNSFVDHTIVQAGFAYYSSALVGCRYLDDVGSEPKALMPWQTLRMTLRFSTACLHLLLVGTHVYIGTGVRAPFTRIMCYVYYGPALAAALGTVFGFWWTEPVGDGRRIMRRGVIAGMFGCFNFVWPAFAFDGQFYHLFRAAADSLALMPTVDTVEAIDARLDGDRPGVAGAAARSKEWYSKPDDKRTRRWLHGVIFGLVLLLAACFFQPLLHDLVRGGQLCFYEDELTQHPEICKSGSEYLDKVDVHTRTLYRVLRNFASAKGQVRPKGDVVKVPTEKYGDKPMLSLFFGIKIPVIDEDIHSDWVKGMASTFIFDYLRSGVLNHLQDVTASFTSAEQAREIFSVAASEDLKPLELAPWDELRSDEAISRFAFAGLAAHRLERVPAETWYSYVTGDISFKSDWEYLSGFAVRPGFERYGAIAYFSSGGRLRKIFWSHGGRNVTQGDPDWEHVKWVFKCTAIAGATLRDHLVGLHFLASNFLASSSQQNLGPEHPLRRLLKPHTYGAVTINMGATTTLATHLSLLHRASSFTWPDIKKAFYTCVRLHRFTGVLEQFKEAGTDGLSGDLYPYGEDMKDFHAIVHRFVAGYVRLYYKDDKSVSEDQELRAFWAGLRRLANSGIPAAPTVVTLVDVLSDFIVRVTAIHNQVGNVADYLTDPSFVSTKIRPGKEVADIQAAFQGLAIGLMTANLQPRLMNSFEHLVLRDAHENTTRSLFRSFQADLEALASTIEDRNTRRRFKCNSINPRTMVSSVSI